MVATLRVNGEFDSPQPHQILIRQTKSDETTTLANEEVLGA